MTTGQFHVSSKQVRLGAGLDKRTSHNNSALRSIVPQTYFQTSRGGFIIVAVRRRAGL